MCNCVIHQQPLGKEKEEEEESQLWKFQKKKKNTNHLVFSLGDFDWAMDQLMHYRRSKVRKNSFSCKLVKIVSFQFVLDKIDHLDLWMSIDILKNRFERPKSTELTSDYSFIENTVHLIKMFRKMDQIDCLLLETDQT